MMQLQRFFTDTERRVRPLSQRKASSVPKRAIINPTAVGNKLPKPSWQQRPLFFSKGTTVYFAVYDRAKGIVNPIPVSHFLKPKRSYDTASKKENKLGALVKYSGSPDLSPAKYFQRRAMAQHLTGGTVVELFAGKGNLSKNVWAEKASKLVLIDKNADYLKDADRKLHGKPHEIINSDNLKWLENVLPEEKIKNLKVVDFDSFGSPVKQLKTFFDNNPITNNMMVAVTDGSALYAKIGDSKQTRRFFMEHYGVRPSGSREEQLKALDGVMQKLGTKHGFKVEPINAGMSFQTIYAGYKITPK